jgi:hypothetical protein
MSRSSKRKRGSRQVGEVLAVAGGEVIDADNGVALAQQAVGQVRTEKSGGAGDKYAHGQSLCSESSTAIGKGQRRWIDAIQPRKASTNEPAYNTSLRGLPCCAW